MNEFLFNDRISISIIIPVFKERGRIVKLVDHLRKIQGNHSLEIIVVDGDARGGTIQYLRDKNAASTLKSPKGRALQMNSGAGEANGDVLLFLHGDTFLSDNALEKITDVMKTGSYVGGAFDLGFDNRRWIFTIIASVASLRSRITRIPFGDQAIFIKRNYFEQIGGFCDIPLMEDVELMRRIKKRGGSIHIVPMKITTSAGKWEEEGVLFTTLRNWLLQFFYFAGVSPKKLIRYYYKEE